MRILWLACAIAIPAAAQTCTIAGVVADVFRGRPLERAHVTLLGPKSAKTAVTTGADGRFSFDVPPGKYTLYAEHNGWRILFGNPEPAAGFGSAIIAGPGQETDRLTLRWYAPGAVFGRVVDEQGEAVRDATVQLIRDGVTTGRRRVLPAGTTKTDDRGEYRFGPVAAGAYYVAATGRPWQEVPGIAAAMRRAGGARQPASAYPPTYYPGATDSRDAAVLTVQSGSEIRADIPLRASAGATVKVRCPGSGMEGEDCQGAPTFSLHGIGGVELRTPEDYDYQTKSFSGVAPGRYTLHAIAPGKEAYKVVDVGPGEFAFDLTMQPPALISGSVTFENPLPPRAREFISLVNETTGSGLAGEIAPDGTFRMYMGGARFRVYLSGSVTLFVAQLSVDGAPVKDGLVDATQNTEVHLKIVGSDEMGRLKGFAMSGDQPAPAVLVVLAPAAGSSDPGDYRGYQTESDGSFDYATVPAGDYLLFAIDRLDLEYSNPGIIRPYLESATPVHIASHSVVDQRVAVTAAKRN
jgi:hypothetical protein